MNSLTQVRKNAATRQAKGFSLAELLVAIAVIGIIAAIALPSFSGVFQRARETKNRRNAQAISHTYNMANLSGATYTGTQLATGDANKVANAQNIVAFYTTPRAGNSRYTATFYTVSMTAEEASACANLLTYDQASNQMLYVAAGDGR